MLQITLPSGQKSDTTQSISNDAPSPIETPVKKEPLTRPGKMTKALRQRNARKVSIASESEEDKTSKMKQKRKSKQ